MLNYDQTKSAGFLDPADFAALGFRVLPSDIDYRPQNLISRLDDVSGCLCINSTLIHCHNVIGHLASNAQ